MFLVAIWQILSLFEEKALRDNGYILLIKFKFWLKNSIFFKKKSKNIQQILHVPISKLGKFELVRRKRTGR